ncbi:serine/threonine-protein kinase [Nocardia sp. NPDC020380]|uniref:serine/threonine-protein kinase n=1 Tax=Nocardia sp. NPDC020380 TaxID=3364309 RepID=UPI00378DF6EC
MTDGGATEADIARVRAALPEYDVDRPAGRGGCGVVLAGRQRRSGRRVAIKQLPAQFAAEAAVRQRFETVGQALTAWEHPHLAPVYECVEHEGLYLLVSEYLSRGTVERRFSTAGFDAPAAVAVALSAAAGLDAAHRRGVLHRAVKPGNLLFAANGTLKLTDLGIAEIVGGDETPATRAGEIVGTPAYLAPEQLLGLPLSPATDVYALVTMLYQLLAGVLPFPPGTDPLDVLFGHAYGDPALLSTVAPAVPAPIAETVMLGLARDPAERFDSAESFGISLADAAAHCWGTNWLLPVGIPVLGADTIVAAATGIFRGGRPQPRDPDAPPEQPRSTLPTGTQAGGKGTSKPSSTRVRPRQPLRQGGIRLVDVQPNDLVPAQRLVALPSPRLPFVIAAVLAVVAVLVAVFGLGVGPTRAAPPIGLIQVNGVDPARVDRVPLDLSEPVLLSVNGTTADSAELSLDVLGVNIGDVSTPLSPGGPGVATALPVPLDPHVLAGDVTAEITLSRNGSTTAVYRFPVHTAQRPLITVTAVGVLLLILLAVVYAEASVRGLCGGRAGRAATVGLSVSTALLGIGAVGVSWILFGREPTLVALLLCAVVGAGAGVVSAVGCRRVGRRYRYVRARPAAR